MKKDLWYYGTMVLLKEERILQVSREIAEQRQARATWLLSGIAACLVWPSGAGAEDLFEPPWRGREGSTYQQWTFDDADNPALPEVMDNAYGDAAADITLGWMASGWLEGGAPAYVQQGLWDLGGQGGAIVLEVDNRPVQVPGKQIWVQVTYLQNPSEPPAVSIEQAQLVSQQTVLVAPDPPSTWQLHQSQWRIEPSSDHEQIVVTADPDWGSVIDQIVVDTYAPDCTVDWADLAQFAAQWLDQGENLEADLDGDGDVDLMDFATLASLWLQPCPVDWPWP